DLFFVAGPALDFLRWLRGRLRGGGTAGSAGWQQVFARAAAGVVAFGLAYAPQLLAYQALNGHPGPTVKVMRKMSWTSPHFVEVLFSPEHGLFFWTPLALIAVLGLAWLCVH